MDRENSPMFRKMTKQSVHLPQEIIEEILSRLGVKSILLFRCVSKSWRSLIASQRFIRTQLQISTKNTSLAHHRVIFYCRRHEMRQCSLQCLLNESFIDLSCIDIPKINQLQRCSLSASNSFRVVGCCNGLFCLHIFPECRFMLWNPATRLSVELPKLESPWCYPAKYGFGLDEKNGAYKVFTTVNEDKQIMGKVYSTNSNSWKTIESRAIPQFVEVGQFVCGKIHWFNVNGHDIESFDLESEEFGRIDLSFDTDYWYDLRFGEVGGCLCVCDHHMEKSSQLDVWVMKEYGVKESWFKLLALPLVQLEMPTHCHYYEFHHADIEGADGQILLRYGGHFLVYYSKDNEFSAPKTIEGLTEYDDALVYVESLVSPTSGEKSLNNMLRV